LSFQLCELEIEHLAERLGYLLQRCGAKIAVAESCTGGGVAQAITSVAGSSKWFDCGLITYSNSIKNKLLEIDVDVLTEQGAVSEATVKKMAQRVREIACADYALAVSGIAGPDGGTIEKPVGTVWFCWAGPSYIDTGKYSLKGNRQSVREQAVKISLQQMLHRITKSNTV
jgi:nicotinamide-nucleotide amidase